MADLFVTVVEDLLTSEVFLLTGFSFTDLLVTVVVVILRLSLALLSLDCIPLVGLLSVLLPVVLPADVLLYCSG